MGSTELPLRLVIESDDEYGDVIKSLALARFVTGAEPWAQELAIDGLGRAVDLVPLGTVVRQVTEPYMDRVLAQADGWTVLVQRYRNGHADVSVTAADGERLAKVAADVLARCPVVEPVPDALQVEFWYADRNGQRSVRRQLDAPRWDQIAGYYSTPARAKVAELAAMGRPAGAGRLLLWHGPPGTGKTTAIRSLAKAWGDWCRTLFVVDPERFLGEAGYLMTVLLGADDHDEQGDQPTWRLIVIEDADELLRADAKRATGQSLSRLLNLADGFIGRGLRTLVLITTNEPLGGLHPAVVRPGRCLAEIEFPALSPAEASALLGGAVTAPLTLAEVFERRGEVTRLASVAPTGPTGQYL
jgi:uncharacterized protein DUF5925/ATPase family protein associated with various cellular activities (AAA)